MKGAQMTQSCKSQAPQKKRTWLRGLNASVTVSAALAIPLFVFAALCLVYLFEINAIGLSLQSAVNHSAKRVSENVVHHGHLNHGQLKSNIIDLVGSERIERSIIHNGSNGISVSGSRYRSDIEELEIEIEYLIRLPIQTFGLLQMEKTLEFNLKPWTGYLNPTGEAGDGEIVYITETGTVYHVNYSCTHLKLSIQFVPYSSLSGIRNESGGIYYSCNRCVFGSTMAGVYITDYGTNYHNSLSCSGLKRTVFAVQKSEVAGWRGCSRCS